MSLAGLDITAPFHFGTVTQWFDSWLNSVMPHFWALTIEFILAGVLLLASYAVFALVMIYMERKICGFFQCRLVPDRVGKWGIFQVFADMLKILLKELVTINRADKMLYPVPM